MTPIFLTTPELVKEHFGKIAPMLEPVVSQAAKGEFNLQDLEWLAAEGSVIPVLIEADGVPALALVFEFVHYPRFTAVNILALGGTGLRTAGHECWDSFREFCREAGATTIQALCSDAMARLLKHYGFGPVYQMVRSPLFDGESDANHKQI